MKASICPVQRETASQSRRRRRPFFQHRIDGSLADREQPSHGFDGKPLPQGIENAPRLLWRQQRAGAARVFDSLLDEQSILGIALGTSVSGLLPIPEIQYLAYLHNAEDQLRGEAASLRFSRPSHVPWTLNISASDGTAHEASDFTLTDREVTFLLRRHENR